MFHQPSAQGYSNAVPMYTQQYAQQLYPQAAYTQDFSGTRPPVPYYDSSTDPRLHFAMHPPPYTQQPVVYPPHEVPVRISPEPDRERAKAHEMSSRRRSPDRRNSPRRRTRSPRPDIRTRHAVRKPSPARRSNRSRSRSPVQPARLSPVRNSQGRRGPGVQRNPPRRPSPSPKRDLPLRSGDVDGSPVENIIHVSSGLKKEKFYDTKITIANDRRRARPGEAPWTGTWEELNTLLEHKRVREKPKFEGSSIDIYKDLAELRRITVEIRRRINGKPSSGPIKRDLDPKEFALIRRAGEGLKPLFDRPELALNEERVVAVKEASPEKKIVTKREKERDPPRRDARSPPRSRLPERRPERERSRDERSVVRADRGRPEDRMQTELLREDDTHVGRGNYRQDDLRVIRENCRPDDLRARREENVRMRYDSPPRRDDVVRRRDDDVIPRRDEPIRRREEDGRRDDHHSLLRDDRVRRDDVRVRREDDRPLRHEDDFARREDIHVRLEPRVNLHMERADAFDPVRESRVSEADLRYRLERRRHSDLRAEIVHERKVDQALYEDRFRPEPFDPYLPQPVFHSPQVEYRHQMNRESPERTIYAQPSRVHDRIFADDRAGSHLTSRSPPPKSNKFTPQPNRGGGKQRGKGGHPRGGRGGKK